MWAGIAIFTICDFYFFRLNIFFVRCENHIALRYPDATQTTPYELYDEDIARERIDIAKGVVEWVKRELDK